MRETTLQSGRSMRKEREETSVGTRALIFLQPVMKSMVREAVPLQPMKVCGKTEMHPMEDPKPQQVDVFSRKV